MNYTNSKEVKTQQYLESIISAIPDLIFFVDDRGKYIDVFPNGKENLLYKPKEEIVGKYVTDFFNSSLSEQFISLIQKAIQTQTLQSLEYDLHFKAEKEYFEARVMPTQIIEDGHQTVMVIVRDISESVLSRKKMQYLATHDALTSLPNRTLLFEHFDRIMLLAKRNANRCSLFFIDIDGFKHINDSYGHKTGDILLKEFASRLSHVIRKSDILGRLSGDEFLLIVEDINGKDNILHIIEKIQTQLSEPFIINKKHIDLTVSIGIASYPDDGESADQLIHAADQAMYNVKKNGKDSYAFYSKLK